MQALMLEGGLSIYISLTYKPVSLGAAGWSARYTKVQAFAEIARCKLVLHQLLILQKHLKP